MYNDKFPFNYYLRITTIKKPYLFEIPTITITYKKSNKMYIKKYFL